MKRNRFSESQIVKAIKEHEGDKSALDICRELVSIRVRFTTGRRSIRAWTAMN